MDEVIKLVQERSNADQTNATGTSSLVNGRLADDGEPVQEQAGDEEDIWGDEEPTQYLEEEFADGNDDFEPMLELDEMNEQND
jgi:hypothetical protein